MRAIAALVVRATSSTSNRAAARDGQRRGIRRHDFRSPEPVHKLLARKQPLAHLAYHQSRRTRPIDFVAPGIQGRQNSAANVAAARATASKRETAAIGFSRISASALMAANPTRRPVKDPGPDATANAPISFLVSPCFRQQPRDLRHKLRGEGAALEWHWSRRSRRGGGVGPLMHSRQRDAAIFSGSIDCEKDHEASRQSLVVGRQQS